MADKLIIIDGIKWWDTTLASDSRVVAPLCIQHNLRLQPVLLRKRVISGGTARYRDESRDVSIQLRCEEGDGHVINLPRQYRIQKQYVIDKIDAQVFSQLPILNLDDVAIPVAKEDIKEKDNPYWVRSKVTQSKSGTRLIIWAGNREAKNKTQLFVEPEIKKLSFDQNDDHPLEVFSKVEVTFADDVKSTIKRSA